MFTSLTAPQWFGSEPFLFFRHVIPLPPHQIHTRACHLHPCFLLHVDKPLSAPMIYCVATDSRGVAHRASAVRPRVQSKSSMQPLFPSCTWFHARQRSLFPCTARRLDPWAATLPPRSVCGIRVRPALRREEHSYQPCNSHSSRPSQLPLLDRESMPTVIQHLPASL